MPLQSSLSRRGVLALLAAGAAAPALQTPAQAAGQNPTRGGILRVVLGRELIGIDPHGASAGVDRNVYTAVYNGLVTVDPNLKIVPDLAQSWTTPNDRTYVFKLRPGVKFHDGTPCDASAVKRNFEYILNPANASQRRPELVLIDRVEAPDPLTVRFVLKSPFAPFLAIISDRAGYIVSPTAREKFGKDFTRNPVGTGPFKFVEWVRDDHLRLRRNDDYFERGLPYLDELVYRSIPDTSVSLTELRTGNVDFLYTFAIDAKDIGIIRQSKNLQWLESPGVGFEGFWLNCQTGPFATKALREALSLAIDRSAVVNVAYNHIGRAANGPIAPSSWAYDRALDVPKRDLAAAKAKLAEGGKPTGFSAVLKAENTPVQQKVTQLLQAQVKEIGIDLRLQLQEFGSVLKAGERNDFDVISLSWSGRIDPDGNIEPMFESKGAFNYGKYTSPEVDAMVLQARQTTNQAERKKIYAKLSRKIVEDVPHAFTYFPPTLFVATTALRGFVQTPDGLMRFKSTWLQR